MCTKSLEDFKMPPNAQLWRHHVVGHEPGGAPRRVRGPGRQVIRLPEPLAAARTPGAGRTMDSSLQNVLPVVLLKTSSGLAYNSPCYEVHTKNIIIYGFFLHLHLL